MIAGLDRESNIRSWLYDREIAKIEYEIAVAQQKRDLATHDVAFVVASALYEHGLLSDVVIGMCRATVRVEGTPVFVADTDSHFWPTPIDFWWDADRGT